MAVRERKFRVGRGTSDKGEGQAVVGKERSRGGEGEMQKRVLKGGRNILETLRRGRSTGDGRE